MSVPGKPKPTLFELKTPKTDRMVVSEYNVWRPERTPDHVANVTMTSMERRVLRAFLTQSLMTTI